MLGDTCAQHVHQLGSCATPTPEGRSCPTEQRTAFCHAPNRQNPRRSHLPANGARDAKRGTQRRLLRFNGTGPGRACFTIAWNASPQYLPSSHDESVISEEEATQAHHYVDPERATYLSPPTTNLAAMTLRACTRWFIHQHRPPHVHHIVWAALSEGTRRAHIT